MKSLLLYALLMSSFSFFFATFFDKDYRETLPISVIAWTIFLLVFGVVFGGSLNIGVYVELTLSFILYAISLYSIIKNKKTKKILSNIFSLPIIIFGIYVVLCYHCLKGTMFLGMDEFSHWGDVVKVMSTIKDFSTSQISRSAYQTYPPGMSIIQYIYEELNMTFGNGFQEWICYFCYDVCILLFSLPFFKEYKPKNIIFSLIYMACIVSVSLPFFENETFTSIYIDPILSLTAAYAISSGICAKTKWDYLYTFSLLSLLVILKDSGMLFAIFGVLILIIKYELSEQKIFNRIKFYIYLVLCVLIPKLTWLFSVTSRNATVNFSGKYDIAELVNILSGKEVSYKSEVLCNYYHRFLSSDINILNLNINISNLLTIVIGLSLVCLILYLLKRKSILNKKEIIAYSIVIALMAVIYIVGMSLTYVFKFTEYEALNLASFNRYINTLFCCVYTILIVLITKYYKGNYVTLCTCILAFISICPTWYYSNLFKQKYPKWTSNDREEYSEICEKINELPNDSKVYLIVQGSTGFERMVIRYSVRPIVTSDHNWSIGTPCFDGDVWTTNFTLDEFKDTLFDGYDYLALYKINDYFVETYGSLFADEIQENCVYKVDAETGLLYLVD